MSFLRLNGLDIPVMSFERKIVEIGSRSNALDGMPLVDIINAKRVWSGVTAPMTRQLATAVRAIIRGDGDIWHFDDNLYSAKGIAPVSGSTYSWVGTGEDGYPVKNMKFGNAVAVEVAGTNMLGADSRDAENAPTGYTAIGGASLSADTTNYWQGTKALKVDTAISGTTEGVKTASCDPGAGTAGNTYAGSVYIRSLSGTALLKVYLRDNTNAADGTMINANVPDDEWVRVPCTITIGGSDCRDLTLEIIEYDNTDTLSFVCDGFQIEMSTPGYTTQWVDGTRTPAQRLHYPIDMLASARDFTLNIWLFMATNASSNYRHVICAHTDGGETADEISLYRSVTPSDTYMGLYLKNSNGQSTSVSGVMSPFGVWFMATGVIRSNPGAGEESIELYRNGSLIVAQSPSIVPKPHLFTHLDIGSHYNYSQLTAGLVDDALIVPYAASPAQITNWYNAGAAMPDLPRIFADGDGIGDTAWSTEVLGTIDDVKLVQGSVEGTWENNLEQISFTLEEC